jgi:hypothetical protein
LIDAIPPPAAEGEYQGIGNESDFELMKSREYIGTESKPFIDDKKDKTPSKDTSTKQTPAVKIGDPEPEEKKKKGIFNKIFKKKKDN